MDTGTDFSRIDLLLYLTERLESGTQSGLQDALAFATQMLGMQAGIVSHIVGDIYIVERVAPADGLVTAGQRFRLGDTFCRETLRSLDVFAIDNAALAPWGGHPCYREMNVSTYIGVPLRVGGRIHGTLNFSSGAGATRAWTESDRQLVRLLGHWVEAALDQDALRRQVNEIAGMLATSNQTQRNMRRAREALVAALPDPLLVLDAEGTCRQCHLPPSCRLPWDQTTVIGQPPAAFLAPAQASALSAALAAARATQRLQVLELALPTRGEPGKPRIYEARVAPGDDTGTRAVLVLLRDLSDREEAHRLALQGAELREANERLRAANEGLETFAYAASHDLRSPLRALANLSTLIAEGLVEAPQPELRTYVELLQERSERLIRLVNDLLAYSRAGRAEAVVEHVDLADLIEEVTQMLAPPPGFVVEQVLQVATLQTVRAPLAHVLSNGIANAIQHHDRSAGHIRVCALDRGDFVELRIEDDGPGIPEAFRTQAFGVFRRIDGRRAGSGLGLALVKKTVEGIGGRAWLEAVLPQGVALVVTWPQRWPERPHAHPRGGFEDTL